MPQPTDLKFHGHEVHAPAAFWGEVAPSEHFLQLYENDSAFMDALAGYVAGGLRAGETAVLIATPDHLHALEQRLGRDGFDIDTMRASDQYIDLSAEETLSRFMVNGWPDETKFQWLVADLLGRARAKGRRVRAFGEMVALLWAEGHSAATVRLEHLWHQLCASQGFSLFCAYPKAGFTKDMDASVQEICAAHSKLIAG